MSRFWLLNNLRVAGTNYSAGTQLDSLTSPVTTLQAAGAALFPVGDSATVDAAGARAQQAKLRGANEGELALIMSSAVDSTVSPIPTTLLPMSVVLLAGLKSTAALVGAPEEVGGAFIDLLSLATAGYTHAVLGVYVRTSNAARAAAFDLYDEGAVKPLPWSVGGGSTNSTDGQCKTVDVSSILQQQGGSGAGWLQLRAWCAGGESATIGQATITFSKE